MAIYIPIATTRALRLLYLGEGLEDGVVVDGGEEEGHLHMLQARVPQLARDALEAGRGDAVHMIEWV